MKYIVNVHSRISIKNVFLNMFLKFVKWNKLQETSLFETAQNEGNHHITMEYLITL